MIPDLLAPIPDAFSLTVGWDQVVFLSTRHGLFPMLKDAAGG